MKAELILSGLIIQRIEVIHQIDDDYSLLLSKWTEAGPLLDATGNYRHA